MGMNNKQETLKLRLERYGYKRIATILNLPVNTVKSYCRRHPVSETEIRELSVCLFCRKPIEQTPHHKKKKFCSDKCRSSWWNSNPERQKGKMSYTCVACGRTFKSYKSKKQKYCSRKCYDIVRGVVNYG